MTNIRKAIIYTRVSTEDQAEHGTSLQSQYEDCCRKAAELDTQVVGYFSDEGISGARYTTRPQIQAALQAIERGEAEILVVYDLSRLSRDVEHQNSIKKRLQNAGGRMVFCHGNYDDTEEGELLFVVDGGFKQYERQLIRRRMMRGKQQMAKGSDGTPGKMPQRKSPYGYHIVTKVDRMAGLYADFQIGEYVVIEEQARWVREIFDRYDAGQSLMRIANSLSQAGILTPSQVRGETKQAPRWYPATVRNILENPVFKGTAVYGRRFAIRGEELTYAHDSSRRLKNQVRFVKQSQDKWIEIPVPSLVDVEQWERCHQRLTSNANEKKALLGGNPGRKYMLTGLAQCPGCGWRLRGTKRGGKRKTAYYWCNQDRACSTRSTRWRAEVLEGETIKAIRHLAQHPEAISEAIRAYDDYERSKYDTSRDASERKRLEAELEQLAQELEVIKQVMKSALKAGLSADDFASDFEEIAKRRNVIEAGLSEQKASTVLLTEHVATTTEKLAAVAQAISIAFEAEQDTFPASAKQALLVPLIDSVKPIGHEEVEVVFRSETLHFIKLKA